MVVKEKIKTPIKLEKEMISDEKTESLPSKKLNPKSNRKLKLNLKLLMKKKYQM